MIDPQPIWRSLAFISVIVLRVVFSLLGCFSLTCMLTAAGLGRLEERLRPLAPLDPATDLREVYFHA